MRIGYPTLNWDIGCTANKTFRLASYSEQRFRATVDANMTCLDRILRHNVEVGLLFFRISSDIIPFASHSVLSVDWKSEYSARLAALGDYVKEHDMRISMHPDQFIVVNSPKPDVVTRSIADLEWQADLLDLMELDAGAKVQIHVGGVYGDKKNATGRFISTYNALSKKVRDRLVIENDHRSYTLSDCMDIHERCGVPVVFDSFHHACLNKGESTWDALVSAMSTWKRRDGVPMTDYSSQEPGMAAGTHARTIDQEDFAHYLEETDGLDFDIMLEIKDKEQSARVALQIARSKGRC